MKVLCIGDLHYKIDNLDQHLEIFDIIKNELIENDEIEMIVVMGDVLHNHERLYIESLNKVSDLLIMLASFKPTYVLIGNHDYLNNKQFLTEKHSLYTLKDKIDNLIIVDKVIKENNFIFMPYVPDGRFHEALNTIENWTSINVIFAHQLIDGANLPIRVNNVERWDEPIVVISGHIHNSQTVYYEDGIYNNKMNPRWFYVGACRQIAVNENPNKKGPMILDIPEESNLNIKKIGKVRIELNLPLYHSITIDNFDNVPDDLDDYTHIILKMKSNDINRFKIEHADIIKSKKIIYKFINNDKPIVQKTDINIMDIFQRKIQNKNEIIELCKKYDSME